MMMRPHKDHSIVNNKQLNDSDKVCVEASDIDNDFVKVVNQGLVNNHHGMTRMSDLQNRE